MSEISDNIRALIDSVQSCMLATIDAEGRPEASTTPYILLDDKMYIFISELAGHTHNLKHNNRCSLMLAEDESKTKNIFARKRLIFKGSAIFIDKASTSFDAVLKEFEAKRGKTVALLKGLKDFHLVEINSENGNYVEGFGAAYRFKAMLYEDAVQETGK